MKHIVDDNGNVHSMFDENYLAMKISMRNLRSSRFDINANDMDEILLSVGQEWYIQQGENINLSMYKIIKLTDKTVSMRHVDHTYIEFTKEFKHLKFIERLK